jgi:hypothetical protein
MGVGGRLGERSEVVKEAIMRMKNKSDSCGTRFGVAYVAASRCALVGIGAAVLCAVSAFGVEYHIAPDGNDSNDGKSRETAFASPTMINSKSVSGNVFHIYPGTYVLTGAVKPAKSEMKILGESDGSGNPVVLDANGIDRGIQCGQANTTIANLKVINGVTSGLGGGAYITGEGSLVSNCVFEGNSCTNTGATGTTMIGAGLYAKNTDVVDCVFRRNITVKGGGGLGKEGTGSVSGCLFESNDFVEVTGVSLNYQCGGGGLCLRTAGTMVRDCTFIGNNSRYGGAMHGNPGGVSNCAFTNNTSSTGGVIQMNGNATTITTQMWERCEFVGNYVSGQGAVFRPRGAGDIMRLDTCLFVSNKCGNGAAIFARDESAGDSKSRVLTVSNCVFRANGGDSTFYRPFWNQIVAPDEIVGCDFLENELVPAKAYLFLLTTGAKVERCSFVGNRFAIANNYGGCLAARGSNIVVRSCLFVTNEVNQGRGICVDIADEQSANENYWATVENCTFAFNVQRVKSFNSVYGGMVFASSNTVIRNCLFYKNHDGLGKYVYQNFSGSFTQAKNIFNCWEAPTATGQLTDGVNETTVDGERDLRLSDPAGYDFSIGARSPLPAPRPRREVGLDGFRP